MAFMHNGVMPRFSRSKDARCDSRVFGDEVLSTFSSVWITKPKLVEMLEEYIGIGNKMIVLRADGKHTILNEEMGDWKLGNWYSNNSHAYSWSSYCGEGYGEATVWDSKTNKWVPLRQKIREESAFTASTSKKDIDEDDSDELVLASKYGMPRPDDAGTWMGYLWKGNVYCQECLGQPDSPVLPESQLMNVWDDGKPLYCDCCGWLLNYETMSDEAPAMLEFDADGTLPMVNEQLRTNDTGGPTTGVALTKVATSDEWTEAEREMLAGMIGPKIAGWRKYD
jgi:hypothetical protein